jgi:hypothetical protein
MASDGFCGANNVAFRAAGLLMAFVSGHAARVRCWRSNSYDMGIWLVRQNFLPISAPSPTVIAHKSDPRDFVEGRVGAPSAGRKAAS